uniref:Serine/threonine-protein phosphatase 6 regulatory ankyrin repeat subunit C n=1 Tax=Sinocyclocheilus grahami TaxID=75366 RepID=A0A672N4T3_SINGR
HPPFPPLLQTPLVQAIFNRNVDEVKLFLHKKDEVNALDQERRTPLHAAAWLGDVHIMELLISAGANVNAKDHVWLTPLHRAAASRNERAVGLLLRKGADVTVRDKFWQTPLHIAAANRATRCIEALLPHVSSLNMADRTGRAPLHHAAQSGYQEVGWNYSSNDKRGYTPLHAAAASGHVDVVKYLLRNGAEVSPNHRGYTPLHLAAVSTNGWFINTFLYFFFSTEYGNTPLHVAAKYGHELLISTLMTNGADTARQGIHGMFPLHLAVLYGSSDCCRKLLSSGQLYSIVLSMSKEHVLSAGFDINTPDNFGRTCLHAAASGGNVECLNLLLSSGADMNKKDKFGRTPLHYAAANGRYQCAVVLVGAGAEVNERDRSGCTPLHYSAASTAFCRTDRPHASTHQNQEDGEKESFLCVEHLLDNGADPSLCNTKGYSAVHYAAAHGNKQNLELLLEMCFNSLGDKESNGSISPLHLAVESGHWECVTVLIESGAYVDACDPVGRSVLYVASQRGHARCVELLLCQSASCLLTEHRTANGHSECLRMLLCSEGGADLVNVTDAEGQTPLMLAVLGGHTDCVHLLLERGACPDMGDRRGRTALHRGAVMGREDCITALLSHSVSVLSRDFQGRTAVHLAASCGHADILSNLLSAADHSHPHDPITDRHGYTPAHWAAYHGHEDCLDVLLELKPCSIQEGNPFTPLHCALINGHSGSAELLLESSVCNSLVNIRDAKGRLVTPLHAAAVAEDVAGLQLVLRHGADINAVDHSGRSALMVAADNGQSVISDFLLLSYANTALHLACSKVTNCALFKLNTNFLLIRFLKCCALLNRGATVLAVDEEGHTPALACASNKAVADCLALILSTMKPSSSTSSSSSPSSPSLNLLKHCGITAVCPPLPNGGLRHGYVKDRHGATIGLDGYLTE